MGTKFTGVTVPLLCVTLFFTHVPQTDAQFDIASLLPMLKLFPIKTKLLLIADELAKRPALYQDLENSLVAAVPLLGYDQPHGRFLNYVFPWALHHLPNLLKNKEFLLIMKTFLHEVNAVNATDDWMLKSNDTVLNREYFMAHLLTSLDYIGMILDVVQARTIKDFFPYNSTDRELNEQCYSDTMTFFDRLLHGDDWALNMFDAIGKPTTGIMRGVLYFIGTYDQCQGLRVQVPINASLGQYRTDTEIQYRGRYCRATFDPPRSLIEKIAGDHINKTYGVPLTLSLGMCLPDSCHRDDIEGLLHLGILGSWFNISVEKAVCKEDENFETDKESHVVIGILGALLLLTLLSSVIDLLFYQPKKPAQQDIFAFSDVSHLYDNDAYTDMPENGDISKHELKQDFGERKEKVADKEDSKNVVGAHEADVKMKEMITSGNGYTNKNAGKLDVTLDSDLTDDALRVTNSSESIVAKLLRSFSVFTNVPAVLSTETKDECIPCIYGIRVITISWIVLGNTYLYVAQSLAEVPVALDMLDSFDLMKRFTMQAVMSASYATDTFFLISGCLISYWFLVRAEMSTKVDIVSWLKFYAGKYWKMTPPYMLVLVTFVYLYMYLGEGPLWPEKISVADSCRKDWWKHLLYVNNLVGTDGVEPANQCMPWAWYIAVNMQFYLISPIILSFISFSSSLGLVITGIIAVAGIVSAGVKEVQYPGNILTSRVDGGDYWNNVFIKPWCRVAPYCVGIVLGCILQKWYHIRLHKILAAALWILAISIGVLLIYVPYTEFVHGLAPWTASQKAAYEALGRPFWAMCVAWVIYACSTNLGGPIGDFLSWKGFVPLSRLSYLVYLIHPVLMVLVTYSRRTLVHLNDFEMAYQFIGHLVVNFFAAFVASLFLDFPFRNIKRIVQKKPLETPF